ncbi:MAG TPA: hypothetical protein VHV53_07390 [Solirubrobacterales bacterium]|jgi:hypothetical protein|nr:hypothetical protein [Solirubrobacterales bacterium]
MRRYVISALAVAALIAVSAVGIAGAAGGEGPVTVKVGDLEVTSDFGFSPRVGSKTRQTPISVTTGGEVREEDGGHPPAARELIFEADKEGEVHTKGIPMCTSGKLQATDTAAALKACKAALIGEGEVTAQVAFAEQKPIDVPSKLLLFNGGEKGGKITWFAHAYFADPVSGAIVTTITITKIHKGRFGTLVVVKIPQIAGGAGSGISYDLEIFRFVKIGGRRLNPISAKCADGKARFRLKANFEDGTRAEAELIRACTVRS